MTVFFVKCRDEEIVKDTIRWHKTNEISGRVQLASLVQVYFSRDIVMSRE